MDPLAHLGHTVLQLEQLMEQASMLIILLQSQLSLHQGI